LFSIVPAIRFHKCHDIFAKLLGRFFEIGVYPPLDGFRYGGGEKIQEKVTAILNGDIDSEVFYKVLLQSLTVFKDRHMELRLNWLPQVFFFAE